MANGSPKLPPELSELTSGIPVIPPIPAKVFLLSHHEQAKLLYQRGIADYNNPCYAVFIVVLNHKGA